MSILTANINFLASLGITTSEQFTAAFGDMADFTEYCTAIGYSWELDENNDIILITPDGKKVNTYVPAEESEKTATPKIVVTPGNTEYTFEAIGDGDVKLYIDETEVSNPVAISRTSEAQEVTVTATAQEQGKQISDEAWEEVTIPALSGPSSISFETDHFTIQGNGGDIIESPEFVVITDDLGNDVTEYCNFTFDPDDKDIHADQISGSPVFSGWESPAGTYSVEMTAEYNGLTATATVDVDITAPTPQSISFDSNTYTITANEGEMNTTPFVVEDDLGNDVTVSCTYTFSPNNTGIFVDDMGLTDRAFNTQYMTAGAYTVTVTATYEGLTATATLDISIDAPVAEDIYFDSASYSLTGAAGDPSLQQNFSVTDDLGNDVTNDCTITLYPNNTGIIVSGSLIDATTMSEGLYHITMTATYGELTATSTIDVDIAAPAPQSISFDSASYSISGTVGDPSLTQSFTVEDDLGNDVTGDCTFDCNPDVGLNITSGEFDATAMSEGSYSTTVTATYGELTATATINVEIAALPITATPTISYTQGLAAYTITATGNGTVLLYADGNSVSNPCSISRTTTAQTIVFTATAQEADHQISATATEVINIPAMEVTATPVITYDSTTFTVDVTGNGTVLAYVDGVQTQMPHTFTQGESEQTYVVTATAQETGKQISATATENCLVPAAAVIKDYMKLSVLNESGNDGNITITIPAAVDSTKATSISYSKDGSNWTDTAVDSTAQTITIPVSMGDEIYLKGIANQWVNGVNPTVIDSTANIKASGNTMSLLYGDNFANQTSFPRDSQDTFSRLFWNNTHLIDASQLELPSTVLTPYCYAHLFNGCTSLTSAPALPATDLTGGRSCYASMFQDCTSLTTAPALPALTLGRSCYYCMFKGCTSLTTTPELPATTLTFECYYGMLRDCTSLTTAPELPATTLEFGCYRNMLNGCTSLNSITMLAEDISAINCLTDWVNGVAASGTFTKSANMTTLPTGISGIPDGWTVVDYTP